MTKKVFSVTASAGQFSWVNSAIGNHGIVVSFHPWQKFDLSDQGDPRFMKTFLALDLINKNPNYEGNIDRTSQSPYLVGNTLSVKMICFLAKVMLHRSQQKR